MGNNLKLIIEKFENLKGQLVLVGYRVERLIGIGTDNDDYYYITYNGNSILWSTCVGKIIPLKGYLLDSDYNELVRVVKLNHGDQISKYKELYIAKLTNLPYKKDKYLTDLCWEIN